MPRSDNGDRRAPLQDIEFELLPPEEKKRRGQLEPLFRWLALIMDDFLRIPGTNLRFGLDPLLGLLPGFGDTTSALVSAFALIQAARRGVPKIMLARMSLNILVNEIVGIVPVIGDAFSFWFKSNARNYELLKQHAAAPRESRRSDWIFVVAVLAALFLVVCAGMLTTFFVLRVLAQLLSGR
ncbi:MAG: DUF4112 domain-containing protein [Chthoniobacterales bacterium]